jgi:hypothetical protein
MRAETMQHPQNSIELKQAIWIIPMILLLHELE